MKSRLLHVATELGLFVLDYADIFVWYQADAGQQYVSETDGRRFDFVLPTGKELSHR